jgi:pimeloyl-ACP methyl ester carboxylesterase
MCLASTVMAVLGGGSVATAQAGPAGAATIDWQPCELDPVVDCGTVTVPVDWARPDGPTVDVAVARRSATGDRIGSLFVNPGGPGNSGVFFSVVANQFLSTELTSRFDIIGFDPRGVVRSNGVQCDPDLADNPVSGFPRTAAEFQAMKDYHNALGRSCAELTGPVFNHIDSANVARDMDAIRAALGEQTISYWGVSYGTLIGQMYAERFPTRVRAMVLDSVVDHTEGTVAYELTGAKGMEAQFLHFAAWAGGTPESPLRGRDVVALWDRLYARATAGELSDPWDPGQIVTPERLGQLLIDNFQNPVFYWDAADALLALDAGDPERSSAMARLVQTGKAEPTCGFCFDSNVYRAVFCEDFSLPIQSFGQLGRIRHLAERVAPHTKINTFNWTDMTGCAGWPAPVGNPQHRLTVRDLPPVLVAGSRADATTPVEWAQSVSQQLPGSRLLVHLGAGHNAYRRSACIQQAEDRYLVDLSLPAAGTTCAAAPVPPRPAVVSPQASSGPRWR